MPMPCMHIKFFSLQPIPGRRPPIFDLHHSRVLQCCQCHPCLTLHPWNPEDATSRRSATKKMEEKSCRVGVGKWGVDWQRNGWLTAGGELKEMMKHYQNDQTSSTKSGFICERRFFVAFFYITCCCGSFLHCRGCTHVVVCSMRIRK